jgi:hypothetical protein
LESEKTPSFVARNILNHFDLSLKSFLLLLLLLLLLLQALMDSLRWVL